MAAVAAVLGLVVLPVDGPATAGAQTAGLVGDAQVVTLGYDAPSPPQARPMASLAGVAFVAPVIKAGFAAQFPGPDGVLAAPAGDELVFVSVDAYSFAPPFGQTGYHYAAPQLTVSFSGHAVSLPESPDGTVAGVAGSAYSDDGAFYPGRWVVAVPRGAPVELTAREGGFTQVLNLRSGERLSPSPMVLYRSPAGPLALDVRPNLAGSLVVSAGSDRVTFPVTVDEAVLSYFRLDSADPIGGLPPDEAYLLVRLSLQAGTGTAGGQYFFDPADPTSALTLTVPGRLGLAAQFGPSNPGPGETLGGVFGFVVPATMSAATLTLGVGDGPAVYADNPSDVSPRAVATGASTAAAFHLQFPPPSSSPAAGGAAAAPRASSSRTPSTTTAPSNSVTAPSSNATRRGGSGWADAGAGAGAAVAVLMLTLFVWRRTRRRRRSPRHHGPSDGPAMDHGPSSPLAQRAPVVEHLEPTAGPAAATTEPAVAVGVAPAPIGDERVSCGLVVRVLGRLEVEGVTGAIRRRAVLRALVVLALNEDRTVGSEELRAALANDETSELSAGTLRSELSRLRSVLPEGTFPDREGGTGYGLAGAVTVDWTVFKTLAAKAKGSDGDERLMVALEALRLVRGPVLENGTWHGIDKTVWEIEAAIDTLAADTAALALQARQPVLAAEAAAQGLLAVPGSPRLWQLRVRAAEEGSGENVTVLFGRARRELGGDLPAAPG